MNFKRTTCLLVILLAATCAFGAEKSSSKEKDKKLPEHQRGWIGGEYKLARRHWSWFSRTEALYVFPKGITNTQRGILITGLSTNTPAYLAGLREADLVLELDHEKISSIADFRRKIDQAKPGASLVVQIYRNGEAQERTVTVGQETFLEHGVFAIGLPLGLPFEIPRPNLKFNPSFSLIALGLTWQSNERTELDSAEEVYRRETEKDHHPWDPYWHAWAGPIFLSRSREIRAQEIVNP